MPLISIIMYVKNGAATIAQAIESVVTQDYPSRELIAVDGASTDGTLNIIRRYAPHFAHIVSEPDSGAFEAANKGVALATGDILLFVMADDWLAPGALTEIAAAFDADPSCEIVSSGVKMVEEKSDGTFATVVERSGTSNAMTLENVLRAPYAAARFYRRRAFDRVGGFSSEYPFGHDRELLLRLMVAGATERIVERTLYIYRRHAGSTTLVFKPAIYRVLYDEHVRMARRYRSDPGFDQAAQRMIADWEVEQFARWVLLELRQGDLGAAMRKGVSGRLYRPSAIAALWRRWRAILAHRHAVEHGAGGPL